MTDTEKSHYDGGRLARRQGCYRLLVCYDCVADRAAWYRGYDDESAEIEERLPGAPVAVGGLGANQERTGRATQQGR